MAILKKTSLLGLAVLCGCAYQVEYQAEYVPNEAPEYVAQEQLLIVIPESERGFVFEGAPISETGEFTTLRVPMGSVLQEISQQVFGSCFAFGVTVVDSLQSEPGYFFAIEPTLQDFNYSYTRVIDDLGNGEIETSIIPQVDIGLNIAAYDAAGERVMLHRYDSGMVSGESYVVTNRPEDYINRTLHAALHGLMMQAAEDIRPLLVGQCEIIDVSSDG
jgi:hypothetical protein